MVAHRSSHVFFYYAVVSLLLAAGASDSFALPSDALVTGAGTKPVSFKKLAEERKMRQEVEARIRKEIAIEQQLAAEKAAKEAKEKKSRATVVKPPEGAGIVSEDSAAKPSSDGSDVAASGNEEAVDKASGVSSADADLPVPSLVILFDHRRVNFRRGLERLLESSEHSKKAVHYSVISEIPESVAGGRRNERVWSSYANNLRDVMERFNAYGVQSSRITVMTRPSDKVSAQTVSIYQD